MVRSQKPANASSEPIASAVAHQPSLACDYYLAVATGTDVIAAEAISVSGVALGTVNVNT